MKSKPRYNGVLAIDKPTGITSHDVVDLMRRATNQRAVGHTGTLDPLASGLLILCLGRATKVARFITNYEKAYRAEIRLGLISATYDAEGIDQASQQAVPDLTLADLDQVLVKFEGKITQQVPLHSAVRVDGKRLYEHARQGKKIETPSREVMIKSIELVDYTSPDLIIEASVSKGTYIRSLAHDIGQALGCGGYLASLRRLSIGRLDLDQALTLDQVQELADSDDLEKALLPIEDLLDFGAIRVTDQFSAVVRQGRAIDKNDILSLEGDFHSGEYILLKNSAGQILAVGTAGANASEFRSYSQGPLFSYERVLV